MLKMNPMLEEMNPWASISEKDKKTYITDMAVMAGMLDAMDYHVGRYIAYLKRNWGGRKHNFHYNFR